MKRIATSCVLAGLLGLSGCADNQESLIVIGTPAWGDMGECAVDPGADDFLALGVFDLICASGEIECLVSSSYFMGVILESQLQPRESNTGTDPSELQLTDVKVSYAFAQLEDQGGFEMPEALEGWYSPPIATQSIAGGARNGVIVEVINPTQARAIYDLVVTDSGVAEGLTMEVTIVFTAERTGNSKGGLGEIESRDYTFPIRLCVGCLTTCAPCENQGCPVTPEWTGGVCGSTQDGALVPAACV